MLVLPGGTTGNGGGGDQGGEHTPVERGNTGKAS